MIIQTNSPQEMSNLNQEKHKGLVMIWFYATWCGHCVKMEQEWDKLQAKHPEEVNLARVESNDYDNYNESPNEDKVQGYPTVRLYHQDKMVKEYDGDRSFKNMYDFIQTYIDENPKTKLNNLMIVRGKKTNKHNAKFLKAVRKDKKSTKLRVPKLKRKRSNNNNSNNSNNSYKPPKRTKSKVRNNKGHKMGRPVGRKNSKKRVRRTKAQIKANSRA